MPTMVDEPLDGDRARPLLAAFEAEIAALYPGWSPSTGPSADPSEFTEPGGLFLIAVEDGDAVGCGGFKRLSATDAEIKRVFVLSERRGAGIAGLLMDALESRARDAGYARVRLDTGARQPDALVLYLHRGYREIDDYNANPFATHWLEKAL